jgi:colanic acid/amylovoran biosynthesis protein
MKIIIVNQPFGNRGDESAHRALIRNLTQTYPETQIEVIPNNFCRDGIKDFMEQHPNVSYFKTIERNSVFSWAFKYHLPFLLSLNSTVRMVMNEYKTADLIVCAPGGICMGGFQNWSHVLLLKLAKYMHKPIAYFGRSIGPFYTKTSENRLFKKYSYDLLRYFGFISLRDSKSVDIAKNIGIDCVSTVDTAFLDSPKVDLPFRIKNQIGNSKYMVFVPNELTWHYAYEKVSPDLIDCFFIGIMRGILSSDSEIQILMLPQTHLYNSTDDKIYFAKLYEKINSNRIKIIDDIYGSDIQQTIIADSEYVIGARYHSIVFAINNAVPFVSLSYEHKMEGLLETLDIKDRIVDIKKIFTDKQSVDEAVAKVLDIITSNDFITDNCKLWQSHAKNIALAGFEKFQEYVSVINPDK